ncbi:MAG: hypothetical protein CL678_06405 [Bdellovibrionaceae bacterium]|nr:hypothetical protein [Pseudobdellovibrionaceae bacterium]|tara:strand:- start:1983 stop:3383 length:1401 start_codon:yes stop_codon:yes gene_type:complete
MGSDSSSLNSFEEVSVIVPVGPGDDSWASLLPSLLNLPEETEIHFVATEPRKLNLEGHWNLFLENWKGTAYWWTTDAGRAKQQNFGFKKTQRSWIWFLHADSSFSKRTIESINQITQKSFVKKIFYFRLGFEKKHFNLMSINECGVWLRSRFLKTPYGDQGFFMHRQIFQELGKFDETLPFGEDHDFIWKAHNRRVRLVEIPQVLKTSPRKYQQHGWFRLTLKYFIFLLVDTVPRYRIFLRRNQSLMKKTAITLFVKTPGISSVKTRLAQTIGRDHAESFYRYSCQALGQVVGSVTSSQVDGVWAVAEVEGMERWKGFRTIHQGEGGLGERLHRVYQHLRQEYEQVIFLGGDSPQISTSDLEEALFLLEGNHDFVLGPAEDGGYFLFGGSLDIPKHVWTEVPYSSKDTFSSFMKGLSSLGSVALLKPQFDVDEFSELKRLYDVLMDQPESHPAQLELGRWISNLRF